MDNRRVWGWKGLVLVSVLLLCVYEMQEIALDFDDKNVKSEPKPVLSMLDIHSLSVKDIHNHEGEIS